MRTADRVSAYHPVLRHVYDRQLERINHRSRKTFYSQFLGPGDLAFDVGANMGNRLSVFAELGATVVAVEPQATCQIELARRFGDQSHVHLVNAGLGPEPGTRVLYIGSEHTLTTMSPDWIDATRRSGRFSQYSWEEHGSVPVITLDQLIEEYGTPRFCKIDVEGFEVDVLRGLSQPLDTVSLEFSTEVLDRTNMAIELLAALGAKQFNFSQGESYVLDLPTWVDRESISSTLAALPDPLAYGDVYARFG